MEIRHQLISSPIKGDATAVDYELIQQQADLAAANLVAVSYKGTRGTCGDERKRIKLLNGQPISEVRPSVFGGPVIHGTAIGELTGGFSSDASAGDCASIANDNLKQAGYLAGGHLACAAAKIGVWMRVLAGNPGFARQYGQMQLGDSYDDTAMDEVLGNATKSADSGRYDDFDEKSLQQILGEEEAGEAFEILADVPHEGFLVERNKVSGTTVDQNAVYESSVAGKGAFNVDDAYAAELEDAVVAALHPADIARKTVLARHAREAIIAAVAQVVPNDTLYQDTVLPSN